MDLQVDFLNPTGRWPVDRDGAARVLAVANTVLADGLPGALPVIVMNAFPRAHVLANFFRRHAAIEGSSGAQLDPRICLPAGTPTFTKAAASAFSNPTLHPFLQAQAVTTLCIIGVFAEGCIRATALAGRALGYPVWVPLDAIATNAPWKLRLATWFMRRHGVVLPAMLGQISS